MKTCKSLETRFPKVSRRSEPCSQGKRPFKVSIFFSAFGRSNFFFFPARHGTGRGGAEALEKKNDDAAEVFFYDVGVICLCVRVVSS